jgi:hypothetical protein
VITRQTREGYTGERTESKQERQQRFIEENHYGYTVQYRRKKTTEIDCRDRIGIDRRDNSEICKRDNGVIYGEE